MLHPDGSDANAPTAGSRVKAEFPQLLVARERPAPLTHSAATARIVQLASRRVHPLVTTAELRGAGISRDVIADRCRCGILQRAHHGVFKVGPGELTEVEERLAAALACNPSAVLLDGAPVTAALAARSGAAQRRIVRADARRPIVASVGGRGARRPGIDVRAVRSLGPDDVEIVDGAPVLVVPLLLIGLAAEETERVVERACDEAAFRGLFRRWDVEARIAETTRRPGATALARILATHRVGTTRTFSEAEERLLAICDAAGFPRPLVNARIRTPSGVWIRPDFRWADHSHVVEVDGIHHDDPAREQDDAWRDGQFAALGLGVDRFTWWHLTRQKERVKQALARALQA